MSHGSSEVETADPREDQLFAAYKHWEKLADSAHANLQAAETNVQLAKLALDRATDRAHAAVLELRSYRDTKRQ